MGIQTEQEYSNGEVMELYESIRSQQENLINQNPASIVISRVVRTESGGGWVSALPVNLDSQNVRIYDKLRYTKVVSVTEAGWTIKKTQKAIALYNANILAESATNLDKFTYNGKTYKVVDVKDMTTQGEICFKEIGLEMIA